MYTCSTKTSNLNPTYNISFKKCVSELDTLDTIGEEIAS